MNPLPNRALLANSSLPLQLPNVPQFDQMAYNGRPRKAMPEVGKDFSMMNGMGMMSGPSTAPAAPQSNPLDRPGLVGPGGLNQPSGQPSTGLGQQAQQQPQGSQQAFPGEGKERDEPEHSVSAEKRDWKERFRLSQEASEQARHQHGTHQHVGVPCDVQCLPDARMGHEKRLMRRARAESAPRAERIEREVRFARSEAP